MQPNTTEHTEISALGFMFDLSGKRLGHSNLELYMATLATDWETYRQVLLVTKKYHREKNTFLI